MLSRQSIPFARSQINSPLLRFCRFVRRFTLGSIKMASALPTLPVLEAISSHEPNSTAVIHSVSRKRFTYGELLKDVAKARDRLCENACGHSIDGQRIAFLVENGYDYVVTLLSILSAHSVALPLSPAFPIREIHYILGHSQASMLLYSSKFDKKVQEVSKTDLGGRLRIVSVEKNMGAGEHAEVLLKRSSGGQGGMMLYTSGTTSRPKGVLLPTSVLTAQSMSLIEAWNYSPTDLLLHVLPLHHIHGVINAIMAPLFAGSAVEFLFPFNADAVWQRLATPFLPNVQKMDKITFFTAVPTVYTRLLDSHKGLPVDLQQATRKAISPENMRLNISGSAPLPTPVKKAWTALSAGNVLLERYGMTEVGMALSCGLNLNDRVDDSVGWPLPHVEVRLVDIETDQIIQPGQELDEDGKERDGEIQVRGRTMLKEYWKDPKSTAEGFVEGEDGQGRWFRTGDIAVRRRVPGTGMSAQEWAKGPMYFIRGRKSADIIKTGGEKVSALEVERELLLLPEVAEAAVVALPSGKWGQKIGAVVVLRPDNIAKDSKIWNPMDMRRALKDKLANYKIPQTMKVVDNIPKNSMGKVNKKELVRALFSSGDEV